MSITELSVDQGHSWALSFDEKDGRKSVVFHTFKSKPTAEDIEQTSKLKSLQCGFKVEPMLWGL